MIKIEIDAITRSNIAENHWKWMQKRFGIGGGKSCESAKKRKDQLFKLLDINEKEFESLIKADFKKLNTFARKSKWNKYTIEPSDDDYKAYKIIKREITALEKQKKNSVHSSALVAKISAKKKELSKYQNIIDREIISSCLGYKSFEDSEKWEKEKKIKDKNSWGGYDYCLALNLKVCPYCNREYINTVDRIKLDEKTELKGVRPDFDHFFPKSKYPFLSCSIFNLIPACKFCNQLKRDNFFKGELIYPYEEEFSEQGKFEIDFETGNDIDTINIEEDINLKLNSSNDLSNPTLPRKKIKKQLIDNSNSAFCLLKIYNTHQDQIKEFVKRIRLLRGSGLKTYQAFDHELLDLYNQQSGNAKEYAKKILLGLPTDTQEYPLRKMKNDILKQIGM